MTNHKFKSGDLVRLRRGEHLMSGWRGLGWVLDVTCDANPDHDLVRFAKLPVDNEHDWACALSYQLIHARFSKKSNG